MCPDDVVPLRERWIDASEHGTAIETPFPNGSMNQFRGWFPFQAHLDFLAAPFLSRINDQRADVFSDVEYYLLSINAVNIHLDHLTYSLWIICRDTGRYRKPHFLHLQPIFALRIDGIRRQTTSLSWGCQSRHRAYPGRGSL